MDMNALAATGAALHANRPGAHHAAHGSHALAGFDPSPFSTDTVTSTASDAAKTQVGGAGAGSAFQGLTDELQRVLLGSGNGAGPTSGGGLVGSLAALAGTAMTAYASIG